MISPRVSTSWLPLYYRGGRYRQVSLYLIFINNLKDDGSVILDCLTIQMQVPTGNSLLGEGIFD